MEGTKCGTKGCDTIFTTSENTKRFARIGFCKPCRKLRNKDLLILIEKDVRIFQEHQVKEAEAALQSLKANVRLDLHKTLDTIDETDPLIIGDLTFCCISYVGRLTTTRLDAEDEITLRIANGQIECGILVFKRGSRKDPEGAMKFTVPGSKAWVNKHLDADGIKIFVDDSDDHVESVRTIGDVHSHILQGGHSLIKLLNEIVYNNPSL